MAEGKDKELQIGFKTTIKKRNGFVITFDYGIDSGESYLESKENVSGETEE